MLRFETSGKQRVVRIVVVWRIERKKNRHRCRSFSVGLSVRINSWQLSGRPSGN
jgi:hypothetical protein